MKKLITATIIGLIAAISIFLLTNIVGQVQQQLVVEASRHFPDDLLGVHSGEQAILLFYFHPECEHCQYEAEMVAQHLDRFGQAEQFWVSAEDSLVMHEFADEYQLAEEKNIHFLSDTDGQIARRINAQSYPTILIYNSAGQLIKQYNGETKIAALLQHI